MAAKLTGRVDVVEMALNHRSGVLGGVAGTYIRETFLDERTRAMQLWGRSPVAAGCAVERRGDGR
jgi:hypothetical protein